MLQKVYIYCVMVVAPLAEARVVHFLGQGVRVNLGVRVNFGKCIQVSRYVPRKTLSLNEF